MLTPLERAERIVAESQQVQLTDACRGAIAAVLDHCGEKSECETCATEVWDVKLANGKQLRYDSSGNRHDNCDSGLMDLFMRCHAVVRDGHEDPIARYAAAIRHEMERFLEDLGTPARCQGCQQVIFWVRHANGKRVPYSEGVNHWQDCPARDKLRKQSGRKQKNETGETETKTYS